MNLGTYYFSVAIFVLLNAVVGMLAGGPIEWRRVRNDAIAAHVDGLWLCAWFAAGPIGLRWPVGLWWGTTFIYCISQFAGDPNSYGYWHKVYTINAVAIGAAIFYRT